MVDFVFLSLIIRSRSMADFVFLTLLIRNRSGLRVDQLEEGFLTNEIFGGSVLQLGACIHVNKTASNITKDSSELVTLANGAVLGSFDMLDQVHRCVERLSATDASNVAPGMRW